MSQFVKLGDVAKVISGYAFKSSSFSVDGTVPVIKIKNIKTGSASLDDADYVDIDFIKKIDNKFHIKSNDILISLTGSHMTQPNSVVGRVGKYPIGYATALLNQRAGKIIPNEKLVNHSYLYYVLLQDDIRHEIAQMAHGAASQANVSPSQIESVLIPLPDLYIQQKIASILSAYDDLIENNNRRIAILEEMARSLYREWFVKFRFPGHEAVKMVDSELGQIPEGWEVKHLENVIDINRGRSYKSSELVEEGGLPFLNLKNIARDGGFRRDGLKWYNGPYKPAQTAYANDIIMAVTDMTQERAVIARPARVPNMGRDMFVLSMDLIKITAKLDYDNGFVYCLLRYSQFSDEVKQFANGANVLHLSPTVIEQYRAIIPPVELQTKFYTIVQGLHRLQDNLAIKNDNLKTQRNMLLPKLISGKLEI